MQKPDLLQGTLDMLILKVLSRGSTHGFGICRRIRQWSDDVLSVSRCSPAGCLRAAPPGLIRWRRFDTNDLFTQLGKIK
jgi:hypothetical protein